MTTRILIMGLPGAGKTTLAKAVVAEIGTNVEWLNADAIREKYNDWDFTDAGRMRQAQRMRELADASPHEYVIADFVCPYPAMREIYGAHVTIWVDTIIESRFADTNRSFIEPAQVDCYIANHNRPTYLWARDIVRDLMAPKNTEKYIYIGGDSFCFFRHDANRHWPKRVAEDLGMSLRGVGYPGLSWWESRLHLLEYVNSKYFADTEYFVFCHTEPYRPLTKTRIPSLGLKNIDPDLEKVRETYYKYIHDDDITLWAQRQWFKEINDLLKDRKVLHLPCFDWTLKNFNVLQGEKFTEILYDLSIQDSKTNDFIDNEKTCNHFSDAGNMQLAEKILSVILQM